MCCTNFFRSSRTFFLTLSGSVARFLKNTIYSQEQPHTQKICSKAAAQIFTIAAHTLRENFHNLSIVMKTSMMYG